MESTIVSSHSVALGDVPQWDDDEPQEINVLKLALYRLDEQTETATQNAGIIGADEAGTRREHGGNHGHCISSTISNRELVQLQAISYWAKQLEASGASKEPWVYFYKMNFLLPAQASVSHCCTGDEK